MRILPISAREQSAVNAIFRAAFILCTLAVLAGTVPAVYAEPVAAFPGAEGHGRSAQGGRGGRIITVTTLADSGPGSLRACVLAAGPRVCVFRVSGVIVLRRSLLIDGEPSSFLSILGQTAPGGGITITVDRETTDFMRTPLVVRNTRHVILRHLRVRSQTPETTPNVDALTIEDAHDVYVDHLSASWASDENINIEGRSTNITIAYSIFGEGLRKHSKCALLGSQATSPQAISFWRNLCISNNDRNPDNNHAGGSCVEIVDNLFYNARSEWAEVFSQHTGGTTISFVGNYFKGGPSTLAHTAAINWNDAGSVADPSIHAAGNAVWAPQSKVLVPVAEDTLRFLVDQPVCPLSVATFGDAARSYREVRARAGAFPRDSTDSRFAEEVGALGWKGTGSLKTEPGDIERVPVAAPYEDADGDGIADAVEARFGARAGDRDAWTVQDDDGWSSFDRFMEWLSAERLIGRYPE